MAAVGSGVAGAAVSEFACSECGKRYKWKPGIAGRAAKCGCGAKLTVPAEDPAAVAAAAEAAGPQVIEFDFVEPEGTAPATRAAAPVARSGARDGDLDGDLDLKPTPVKKVSRGTSIHAATRSNAGGRGGGQGGGTIAYEAKPQARGAVDENMSVWGSSSERVAPIVLLVASTAVFLGTLMYQAGDHPKLVTVIVALAGMQIVAMTLAAFVVASTGAMSFGVLGLAVLRFAAVLMSCEGVHSLFDLADIPFSGILRMIVVFGTFYGLMMWLFGMDFDEVRILAFVYVGLKFALGFLLMATLMSVL